MKNFIAPIVPLFMDNLSKIERWSFLQNTTHSFIKNNEIIKNWAFSGRSLKIVVDVLASTTTIIDLYL